MKKICIMLFSIGIASCSPGDFASADRAELTDAELQERTAIEQIDFGSDDGDYSNDEECDDPRFNGPGMTTTTLLDEDIRNDASDCRAAYQAGQIMLETDKSAD